jgi:hypothetical protein
VGQNPVELKNSKTGHVAAVRPPNRNRQRKNEVIMLA